MNQIAAPLAASALLALALVAALSQQAQARQVDRSLVAQHNSAGVNQDPHAAHLQHQPLHTQQQQQQKHLNHCQSGWMWYNNKCWVTTQSRRDFVHAAELCKRMYNSTLPTIHSEDENEFLRQNIDLQNSPIWLYARHNHQYNTTTWLDKSPVNYTRWEVGQPSEKSSLICIKTEDTWYMKKAEPVDGQTECVSFWGDAKWGTQVGCLVLLPVVCERKLAPNRAFQPPLGSSGSGHANISHYDQQQMYSSASGCHQSITNNILAKTITSTIVSLLTIHVAYRRWNENGKFLFT